MRDQTDEFRAFVFQVVKASIAAMGRDAFRRCEFFGGNQK